MFKSKLFSRTLVLVLAILAGGSLAAYAQNVKVTGRITEPDGTPVAGAAVFHKEARNHAVVSTSNGEYAITVPKDATLLFTCIGYSDTEVSVAGRGIVNVVMEIATEFLDDVVVTAQGLTRKQKAVGYSAQKLEGDELSTTRITDINNALVGKVSGVQFWGKSGATFDTGTIVLRGTTSYNNPNGVTTSSLSGNEPIYVVDGTITSASAVNMDDVESINVLKGPSATALYGSRGANGAIIITTAKGYSDKGTVSFSHTTTLNVYYNHLDFNKLYGGGSMGADVNYYANKYGAGTYDYTSADFLYGQVNGWTVDGGYYYDYYSDENWGARYDSNVKMASALYWDETSSKYHTLDPWTYQLNINDLLQTGVNNTTNVAVSKSGEGYSTRISFTNVDMSGVMLNSKATRRFLSVATSLKPAKWLNVDLNYKYTTRYTKNGAREGYAADGNVIYDWTQWGQTNVNIADYKDYLRPDGTWRTWNIVSTTDLGANFHDNPYATMYNYNRENWNNYHVFSGDVYSNITDHIRVGYRLNGNITNQLVQYKYNGDASINFESYFREYQLQTNDYTHQGYITYDNSFFDDRLTAEVALFAEERQYDYYYLNSNTNNGLSSQGVYNLASSVGVYSTENTDTHFKTRSFFGTATLGWDDTYFVDLSLRNDIDSRLPQANNSYLYGGASVSVMLSQLINAPWLNFWKLRGSLAQVGATLDAYDICKTYTVADKHGSYNTLYESSTQVNQNLLPSISTSYEVGTEFKMFKNRFYGDVNFYQKDTKNQIINANVVPQSGYLTRQVNAGLIRNKGVEILLGGTPVQTRDFSWDLSFNISKNINTLEALTEDQTERTLYSNRFYYNWNLKAVVGKPVGVITTMARWERNDAGQLVLRDGNSTWGDVRPTFELNKEKEVGNVQPDFTGGFSTSFRYKNLTLNASLDFSVGGQLVSWTNMWGVGSGTLASSAGVNNNGVNVREPLVEGGGVYVEGVDKDGNPKSGYMDAYMYYHYLAYYDNDNWVYDRTYVKLRELSLTYRVPDKWIKNNKLGVSEASVSFVATNPWLIYSACPNIDPSELGGASYGFLEGGSAISTRSFGLSLNVTF